MNDDSFARLVAEEVKNRVSKSQREFLQLPDNWTRWQRALVALCENLDGQLKTIVDDERRDRARYEALGHDGVKLLAEAMTDYEGRRSKIQRFKFHVEKRLDEVTRMIALGVESADENIGMAMFLRAAITKHRDMLHDFDIEATPIDQALWSALTGEWMFDSVSMEDI